MQTKPFLEKYFSQFKASSSRRMYREKLSCTTRGPQRDFNIELYENEEEIAWLQAITAKGKYLFAKSHMIHHWTMCRKSMQIEQRLGG